MQALAMNAGIFVLDASDAQAASESAAMGALSQPP
jgi:hypothetical protein